MTTASSVLDTNPDIFEMASTESLPLGVDMAALLAEGETISSPSATLTDLDTGLSVPASVSAPAVAGSVVTQTLTALEQDRDYRLAVSFTAGGKTWTTLTLIRCKV